MTAERSPDRPGGRRPPRATELRPTTARRPGPAAGGGAPDAEEQVAELLHRLRAQVRGVLACLVATSDGLLVGADAPGLEAPQTAALTSTMTALARHAVQVTRRGELLDAVVRGTDGHLAVFAIGETAVLAVVAHPDVTAAWLHLKTRPFVQELLPLARDFTRFYTG